MPSRPEPSKWVRLDFPQQFRIGLRRLSELCDWHIRERDGSVFVATEERYRNVRPQLIRLVPIADAANASDATRYERFRAWPGQDAYSTESIQERVLGLEEVKNPTGPTDTWVAFRLMFMTVPDADLPGYVQAVFSQAVEAVPTASLWAIEIDPRLTWRVAAVRALFSAQESPEVLERTPDRASESRTRFLSAQGLSQSWTLGLSIYTEPALLPASPWITGLSSYRNGGIAVILFGRAEAGFVPKQAAEGLDLFRPGAIVRGRAPVPRPDHRPETYSATLRWWTSRLNDLFAMALDIGRFAGPGGEYRAAAHLGVLLSLERLFASIETLLADAGRAEFTRLLLFFDVIDLFDGLSFGSWDSLLRRDKVERDLARLRETLPPDIRDLMLTRCEPAVAALRDLEDGFVLSERVADGYLRLRQRDGVGWQNVPLRTAVPKYLRVARNATHSFRAMARDPHDVSLLAAHTGDIPDAVSDLAFLHLLRFLQRPHLPAS